jgi:hypothetical protein
MATVKINGKGLGAAAAALATKVADHLNTVVEKVSTTHAGKPVDEVLVELRLRATSRGYQPGDAELRPAAEAISSGKQFSYVSPDR